MEINQKIESLIGSAPIVLFMKGSPDFPQCGFSAQTVAILKSLGKEFDSYNILEDQELREGLKVFSSWPTFPQLYVNKELIGGCDIVTELFESGELKEILES
ncbi:MAG: Grx4 family monothiol glutaredoxin [Gammaproteobacteria bacterium]|jgi:monothiol glutaredoxin